MPSFGAFLVNITHLKPVITQYLKYVDSEKIKDGQPQFIVPPPPPKKKNILNRICDFHENENIKNSS